MNNDKEFLMVLEAFDKLRKDAEERRQKQIEKMFAPLDINSSLEDFLNTFSRADLDNIRQSLKLQGVSSLRKAELIAVLNENIKLMLPEILGNLTDKEYKLLIKLLKNGGIIKFEEQYSSLMLYFRNYGIVTAAEVMRCGKYLVIPRNIRSEIKTLFNRIDILNRIKLNERVNRLSRGLLFYYGVLDHMRIEDMVKPYLREPVYILTLNNILFENLKKEYGLSFDSGYWCHDYVDDYKEILAQQKKRPSLDYLPLTVDQLLAAGQEDYREWNKYDKLFYSYLLDNFDIPNYEAEELVEDIKLSFKNGCSFSDTMEEIGGCFDLAGIDQVREVAAFLQDMYNNSSQWVLKGHSPSGVMAREHMAPLPDTAFTISNTKPERNTPCPCGSGKKYKNCCMTPDN